MSEDIRKVLNEFEAGINELKAMVSPVGYYMDIKALSSYSGISTRKLKELIRHPEYPLPAYKIDGCLRIKKSEFDKWISRFRLVPESNTKVENIVSDIMKDIKKSA